MIIEIPVQSDYDWAFLFEVRSESNMICIKTGYY